MQIDSYKQLMEHDGKMGVAFHLVGQQYTWQKLYLICFWEQVNKVRLKSPRPLSFTQ